MLPLRRTASMYPALTQILVLDWQFHCRELATGRQPMYVPIHLFGNEHVSDKDLTERKARQLRIDYPEFFGGGGGMLIIMHGQSSWSVQSIVLEDRS